MNQKKQYLPPPPHAHYYGPIEPELFCPRYRMADRTDLYMWESMEQSTSSDIHMEGGPGGPLNRPPPPLAHTGPHQLFPHAPPPVPPPPPSGPGQHTPTSRAGQEGGAGGGGGNMGHMGPQGPGGMGGGPPNTLSAAVTSTSPLVVPTPKMARPIKTYHCRMCDQIFESKSDLLVHSQQVHKQDPKPYKCPTCNKCFANSSYLSQHARIHSGIKPYKCQICERRFTQLCHLQQHIRTHTGEKPYKCQHPGCGKAFSQLSNLQSHSRSHMTDKPYRCNSCYKCFTDEHSLREHIPKHSETKHIKTHICRMCGKAYTQETYLARHMTKHTGDTQGRGSGMGVGSQNTNGGTVGVPGGPSGGPGGINSASSVTKTSSTVPSQPPSQPGSHHDGHDGMKQPGGGGEMDMVGSPTGQDNSLKSPSMSAFMPLPHQFASPSLMNSSVPSSSFPFSSPRLPNNTLNSPLSHIPSGTPSRSYFGPFDPMNFPKRDPMDRPMSISRDSMIANSLLSLQQIKNFSTSHPVFPKSEPSSPVHKEFP